MDNATFKEMIKRHQVKQSFVMFGSKFGNESLYRFYQDTIYPDRLYMYVMFIDNSSGELVREVYTCVPDYWYHSWCNYVSTAVSVSKNCIKFYREAMEKAPEQVKEFWKLKISTVIFMLKDKRIYRG